MSKKLQFMLLVLMVVLILGGAAYGSYYYWQKSAGNTNQRACTEEAKLCPDGSSVGRVGPNCEFQKCSSVSASEATANWQTYKNDRFGFEIKHPKNLKAVDYSTADFGSFNFTDNSGTNLKIYIKETLALETIENYLLAFDRERAEAKDSSLAVEVKKVTPIKVAGVDGVRRIEVLGGVKMPAESVYFLYNGRAYQISVWVNTVKWQTDYVTTGKRPSQVDSASLVIFENFLNAFKFIEPAASASFAPRIISLRPNNGPIETSVGIDTEYFNFFAPNTRVIFIKKDIGEASIPPATNKGDANALVPNNDGYFKVPAYIDQYFTCPDETICSQPPPAPVTPGVYSVKVMNSFGTSNSVEFTVTQ